MTTSTRDQAQVPATMPTYLLPQRVTQARVLRSEWTGFGIFCLYAAVILVLAAQRMRRGDA